MTYQLTWLPDVLEQAGLKVAETPGWRTRGRGEMGPVRGVICHHTATRTKGNMPSLNLIRDGRKDLVGPLAQLGLGRDGTFYVIAAGRANHAGAGQWEGLTTGNWNFIGIEAENDGQGEAWPPVQMDAYQRGVAAILGKIHAGANMCCGHKEYAPKRKIDPNFPMLAFRSAVAALLQGKTPPPPIAARDQGGRDTLRRSMTGPTVVQMQTLLGAGNDGIFGPQTEARVRVFQRDHGLVPDGIVGPATWRLLDPAATAAPAIPAAGPAAVAAAVAPAPAAPAPSVNIPQAEDATSKARSDGRFAYGPNGKDFATVSRAGFYTSGITSIATGLAKLPSKPAVSDSAIRVLTAMSVNEGRFEAINSYDPCFLSFGILQWTAGQGAAPGELAYMLSILKKDDRAAFDDCFGRYGLDVDTGAGAFVGHLMIDGRPLRQPDDKKRLRDVAWAYRFWRAGHHPSVRKAQLEVAISRVERFRSETVAGHRLDAWITSERGIAHLLDEHVNRPSHVPGTFRDAVADLYGGSPPDPATLDDGREAALIDAYLDRRSATDMTKSDDRAAAIDQAVSHGALSDKRGSFG